MAGRRALRPGWPARVDRGRLVHLRGHHLGLALASPGFPIVVLWALYGVYYGVSDAVGKALIADVVPPAQRATEYGILNMATGLVLLPASILAGLLWGGVGPHAPFWFGAACAAAAVILLGFIHQRSNAG